MLSNLSFKQVILIDGIGALVTALLLSLVLAQFEAVFGMPKQTLSILAAIACCFAIYSWFGYFFVDLNWRPYLKGIALANILYCLTTLVLVIYLYQSLTWLGVAYFLGEMGIILTLVYVEFQTIAAHPRSSLANHSEES